MLQKFSTWVFLRRNCPKMNEFHQKIENQNQLDFHG